MDQRRPEHPETFALVFREMFVVDLVCFPDRAQIPVLRIPEQFDPLMDEDLVDEEVCDPVKKDPRSDPRPRLIRSNP